MIEFIKSDIKLYMRINKNEKIYTIIKIIIFTLMFINIGDRLFKYGEEVFMLILSSIIFQGIYSMSFMTISQDKLNSTKHIFTFPLNIKKYIISKNILAFALMYLELVLLQIIFKVFKIVDVMKVSNNLVYVSALIITVSISNVLFNVDRNNGSIRYDKKSIFVIIGASYKLLFILILISLVILAYIKVSFVNIIIKIFIAISAYIIILDRTENILRYQARFFEKIE